jgi:hypothetical protein
MSGSWALIPSQCSKSNAPVPVLSNGSATFVSCRHENGRQLKAQFRLEGGRLLQAAGLKIDSGACSLSIWQQHNFAEYPALAQHLMRAARLF